MGEGFLNLARLRVRAHDFRDALMHGQTEKAISLVQNSTEAELNSMRDICEKAIAADQNTQASLTSQLSACVLRIEFTKVAVQAIKYATGEQFVELPKLPHANILRALKFNRKT